ncbi:MAG: sigma-70 family RNA polymerase sigma factor [Planctomycetes bacterium]|nr:sigma-70 family RNA polymerase sigma factor [Planctomycetota bacterium]
MDRDETRAARGEFARAYEPLAPALRAWAALQVRGPLGSVLDADDLVQEVLVQLYGSFARFDPARGDFRGWTFGVASRVAQSLLRRLARSSARGGGTALEPLASRADSLPQDATTISRRVARDEGMQRFLARVLELDEDDRRLLVHRGLEGLGHAEVGALLGWTPDQANKRWQRLRTRLRDMPAVQGMLLE